VARLESFAKGATIWSYAIQHGAAVAFSAIIPMVANTELQKRSFGI
jgi:hypothetical protein